MDNETNTTYEAYTMNTSTDISYRRTTTKLENVLLRQQCTFTTIASPTLAHIAQRAQSLAEAPWAVFHIIGLYREDGLWHLRLARRPGYPKGYMSVNPLAEQV